MVELTFEVVQDQVDPISDALMDHLEALSISVEDADSSEDSMLFGEPGEPIANIGWRHSSVRALFTTDSAASAAAAALIAQQEKTGVCVRSIKPVAQQDWVRLTQSQFGPVQVSPSFWVVPSWHQPPQNARCVLSLDPGLAFGTGTHPTTKMCLRWIESQFEAHGKRVLDYGCGSGILAIAAAKFGAAEVDAVDVDPDAIDATRANALANDVAVNAAEPDAACGSYSLVLANILAAPLTLLAPALAAHVRVGGDLVLAGILARQTGELQAAYAPWLKLRIHDNQDGWVLMTGRRSEIYMSTIQSACRVA